MKIEIPKSDLLKNRPLAKGWYPGKFLKFETKPSKDKGSTNFMALFQLDIDGREMDTMVANSKAMGMMENFAVALSGKPVELDPETKKPIGNFEFDPDMHLGKPLKLKVVNENFDGRLVSKIKDYLPIDAVTTGMVL